MSRSSRVVRDLTNDRAVALHSFAYNFCRPHQTLTKRRKGIKTTPAMASGLTDHVWKMEELLGLMEESP